MQTEIIQRIANVLRYANRIWIIGNGGSASLADHFACDLLKNCGLPAISLCSNQALITAIANDIAFKEVFVKQLRVLLKEGDILVAFSTRGKSPNVVSAMKYVDTKLSVATVGIAGFGGGELKKHSYIFYHIDSSDMQFCEDEMNRICHKIVKGVKLWEKKR